MECNKDEALRAKSLAERKMLEKDFVAARKMINKAQQLSSEIDNISQMLTVCDIHCAAGTKVNGEIDWYGILQVPVFTNDATLIKKHYRKLTLLLHPDKNKFAGAEAAFKLVGEANMTLTDSSKRSVYDMKRRGSVRVSAHDLNNQHVPPVANQQPAGVNRGAGAPSGVNHQSAGVNRSAGAAQNFPGPQINVPGQQARNYATQGVHANYGSHNVTVNTKRGEDGNRASAACGPKENTKFARASKFSSTSGLKRGRRSMVESSGWENTTAGEESDDEDVDDDGNYKNGNTINYSNSKRLRKGDMLHSDDQINETKLNEDQTGQSGSANGLNHENICNSDSSSGLDPNFDASGDGKLNCVVPEFFNFDRSRDESQFRANQIWAIYDTQGCIPRFYARITKVKMAPKFIVHFVWLDFDPTNKAEEAWSIGDLPVACGHFKYGDPGTTEETNMFSHTMYCVKSKTRDTFEMYPRKGEVWALFKRWDIGWSTDADNHTDFEYEVVQVVSDFMTGTSIIVMPLVKIKGFVSLFMQSKEATPYVIPQDNTLRFSHLVPCHLMCGTEREGIPEGALELDPAALPLNLEAYASVVHPKLDASDEDKIRCVDPEFFCFDQIPDVSQFRANQIWAVFDSQGCMPRFYARIKKVKMAPKFVVHFVWLEFDPTNKAEEAWSKGELPAACGHFKYGDSETAKETNMFSHTMYSVKSKTATTFEIYPQKGEVWALFKGWDIGWSSDASNHTEFEYEVVRVVSDLTAGTGIIVMPLVKLKGFVSLFMQSKEATPYLIPQDNALRFSHLVPHHKMCGTEREGIPEGALELDPAALPLNLEEAFPSVVPESSSVKGQEFATKCAGSSSGNNSGKVTMRVGETAKEKNIEHIIPPAVEITGEFEVADSEFYVFAEMRVLHKFEPGQVWAIYSDVDKFPNFYALIKNVDLKNNKVKAKWLDVCPLGEVEKRLVKEDRTVGCGTFKVSVERDSNITYTGTESFSHRVLARPTGRRNEYEIIPQPGDMWAIYKNWRAGWTAQDFKNCEYELVEILAHTDNPIQVQLLRKVDGYTAVFRRDDAVKAISKDEYPKFSHQVPCFHLTIEKGGKLRGYLELDPYSLPDAFLYT